MAHNPGETLGAVGTGCMNHLQSESRCAWDGNCGGKGNSDMRQGMLGRLCKLNKSRKTEGWATAKI
jgi:hypothetical protein